MVDSLVRVSRRVGESLFGRIARSPSGNAPTCIPELTRRPRFKKPLWMRHPILPIKVPKPPVDRRHRGPLTFTSTASFSTVSGLLTLFSKFFSSFLHSTCSLSVSHTYLALEEVYLPLRAAILNNPTLERAPNSTPSPTGLSPSTAFRSRTLQIRAARALRINPTTRRSDYQYGHLPLHSPLLGQSSLFSSPPLSDMLKFSG